MSGAVRISRELFDDTAFKREPFTEREAFVWLIMEASFKARMKRVGNVEIPLQRGQLAASLRFMAEAFQWSEARVRRYFDRLKKRRMIDAATDAGITVVSVCKYNDYQSGERSTDAPEKTGPTQQRRTADANENKGEINAQETIAPAPPDGGSPPKPAKRRGTRVDGFEPSIEKAIEMGLSPERARLQSEKFLNYWSSKSGDATKLDWSKTWVNWIIGEIEKNGTGGPQRGNGSHGQQGRPTHKQTVEGFSRALVKIAARNGEHFTASQDLAGRMEAPGGVREREITLSRGEGGDFGDDTVRPFRARGFGNF